MRATGAVSPSVISAVRCGVHPSNSVATRAVAAAVSAVRELLTELGWHDEWITDLGGIRTARATEAAILFVPHVIRAGGFVPFAISVTR